MSEGQSNNTTKQASYNKNEKTKDVRTTNIQAAKGNSHHIQLWQIASELVLGQGAWIR